MKFIVEEMRLALHLVTQLTDPFIARSLARHILIRAENFIEHARGLRKPLSNAGYNIRDFHKAKEVYASFFDEYFKISRDRLGAHVQDLDFGKRVELWNDIEILKISFFVDAAEEIYQILSRLSIPGYITYTAPPELTEPNVLETLHQYHRSIDNRSGVEIGTDSLAITRSNTTATFNMTPVHARAAQLALIRRWIKMQSELLDKLLSQPRLSRILKARIITDIVSFCDCLVTRSISPESPQAMDGLDMLVIKEGQSCAPIENFVSASNFQSYLQEVRVIRDTIGAHLEIDNNHNLSSLISNLDAYDIEYGIAFYKRANAAFTKTCYDIIFLRIYAADGHRIYGVSATGTQPVPFSEKNVISPQPEILPLDYDEDAYHKNLRLWLDGDDEQKEKARNFFWNAFAFSPEFELVEEVEPIGTGQRISQHVFRDCHKYISTILSDGISNFDFSGILDLTVSCRSGYPYQLSEVLVRYGRSASLFRQRMICYALGEIGSHPHASVNDFLTEKSRCLDQTVRLISTISRFKIFVKSEGLFRINNRGKILSDYDFAVDLIVSKIPKSERIVCLLAFASILSSRSAGSLALHFQENYAALQHKIEMECLPLINKLEISTLKKLIDTNDYVGLCVLIASEIDCGIQNNLRDLLLENCCSGTIFTAGHDQSMRHLAICFILRKEDHIALEIANTLASRNPDWIDIQIFAVEILAKIVGAEKETIHKIAEIRRTYKLNSSFKNRISALELSMLHRS